MKKINLISQAGISVFVQSGGNISKDFLTQLIKANIGFSKAIKICWKMFKRPIAFLLIQYT